GRSKEQIKHARENGSERSDKILGRPVRRRQITPRAPRGEIARAIGNQREEEERASKEQNDREYFIPPTSFCWASHFADSKPASAPFNAIRGKTATDVRAFGDFFSVFSKGRRTDTLLSGQINLSRLTDRFEVDDFVGQVSSFWRGNSCG